MRWPMEPTGLPRGSGESRVKRSATGLTGLWPLFACEEDGQSGRSAGQAVGSNLLEGVTSTPLQVACNWTHDSVRSATKMGEIWIVLTAEKDMQNQNTNHFGPLSPFMR
jgi:hypothetical protein